MKILDNSHKQIMIGNQTIPTTLALEDQYVNVDHKFVIYVWIYFGICLLNIFAKLTELVKRGKRTSRV